MHIHIKLYLNLTKQIKKTIYMYTYSEDSIQQQQINYVFGLIIILKSSMDSGIVILCSININ